MPTIAAAQFLPLQYPTAAEFERAMMAFQLADGDPRRARTRDDQEAILALGGIFKTAAHRAWLKEFREALRDDDEKWFRSWWSDEQKARLAALTAFDLRWQRELRPAMQRWLNASNAADGEIILSPVLEAEGRTVTISKRRNAVVIGWPRDTARADEAFFAFCHEIVGSVSAAAIADNLTPAQQRDGIGERLQASGLVRGGLELVRAVAPTKVDAYARFYLRAAGLPMGGDAVAALEANFALPDAIVAAIKANIAAGFGGI
jgi:hypothetical protein